MTTGNPLFDDPSLKAALTAQMQPQPQGAVMPPGGAGEPQGNITLPSTPPPTLPQPPQPFVLGPHGKHTGPMEPQGTLRGDQQKLEVDANKKAPLESVYSGITGSKFGQAHPLAGKLLGGLAQIPATIGDIALTLPMHGTLAALTPGTSLHRGLQIQGLQNRIGQEETNAEKEAQTQEAQGRAQLTEAQAENLPEQLERQNRLTDAQIINLMHPQAKTAFESWRAQNPNAPVEDWLKAESQAKPKAERPDTPEQQFIDEFQKTHPNGSVADAVHAYAAATQKPERGPTIIQQTNEADKIAARLGKPYETGGQQGQGKMDRIDQTLRSVDAGYVGQGLAIPELLTSLVSGQGTGVRITQPELNMITAHRGIVGNAESWFNSLAGKGNLTKEDKAQIKSVLGDAKTRLLEKMQLMNDAQDAINGSESRANVVEADKKFRAIQLGMEKYREVRRDDQGNWYGSNDGGKTTFDLATGKEAK